MFEMIDIEGSTFRMGCDSADTAEMPVHSVSVSDFSLGSHPVTQKQWLDLVGTLPNVIYNKNSLFPVTEISWFQVVDFCNLISLKSGLKPCYKRTGYDVLFFPGNNGYRLPTEAEWEYAARGGKKSGSFLYAGSNNLNEVAWYVSNSNKTIQKVCQKKPNELGLFDMSGNVYEFCWDVYDAYTEGDKTDPLGPVSGAKEEGVMGFKAGAKVPPRVMRGGNCFGLPFRQRNSSRYKYQYIGFTHDFISFRLARNL